MAKRFGVGIPRAKVLQDQGKAAEAGTKFGELMELEGMTEATAKDFLAAITASKTRDWWRALAGLGIPQVDAGVAQSLARTFKNLDDLAGAPLARLTAQAGPAVAQSMANWFGERQNRKLIQRLGKAGLF